MNAHDRELGSLQREFQAAHDALTSVVEAVSEAHERRTHRLADALRREIEQRDKVILALESSASAKYAALVTGAQDRERLDQAARVERAVHALAQSAESAQHILAQHAGGRGSQKSLATESQSDSDVAELAAARLESMVSALKTEWEQEELVRTDE